MIKLQTSGTKIVFGITMNYRSLFVLPNHVRENVVVANWIANQVVRYVSLHVYVTNENSRYLRLRRRPSAREINW